MSEKIAGYKGFDKDLKCQGHQFKIGETYIHDGDIKLCKNGFHFCEHPLDVFNYYSPASSRFAEVEGSEVSDEKSGDTKRVTKRLTIKAEINFKSIVEAAVKFIFDRADWSEKKSQNDKKSGAASATGWIGAASATGWSGAASATGVNGIACGHGILSKAKAAEDNWIVLSEWKEDKNGNWNRVNVITEKVDGKKIKADTWYILKNGKFEEAKS